MDDVEIKKIAEELGVSEDLVSKIVDAVKEKVVNDVLDSLSDKIRKEIEAYAESDPAVTRRGVLKLLAGVALFSAGIGRASATMNISDYSIVTDGREVVLVPRGAKDGQIIVRQGNAWMPADPSIDKWGGVDLTGRDITQDIKRLSEAMLASFRSFRVFPPNFFKPKRTFNLYVEVPSDSASDVEIGVVSGSGTSTETIEYVNTGEIAWIESTGIKAEFSSTPDVTWNAGKFVRLKRKHYTFSGQEIIDEEKYGGKDSDIKNWRHLVALSENFHYSDNFKKDSKGHLVCDLVALDNYHYWFINEKGDEYIKLVADAGCFTYTNDVVALYMKGMIFDVNDILVIPTE